jgi:hypothetical protein
LHDQITERPYLSSVATLLFPVFAEELSVEEGPPLTSE